MKTILHVDMDAFYASVEQRDDPSLRGKPVIVGGPSRRGVVLAASYEVRPFGVRSAMPMAEALRRAPHAIVVPPRRDRYAEASAEVFAIFRRYTPLVEALSLDEAFLDVTGEPGALRRRRGDRARHQGATCARELQLTASAGVAPCKFVAKIASDLAQARRARGRARRATCAAFLAPLPIERMWGVGPKTAPRMRALGYATIGDLARADAASARAAARQLGPRGRPARARRRRPRRHPRRTGEVDRRRGDVRGGPRRRRGHRRRRSSSTRGASRGGSSAAGLSARTVTVKIKYADFTLRTRRATLPEPVQDTDAIHRAAVELPRPRAAQGRTRAAHGGERGRRSPPGAPGGALP